MARVVHMIDVLGVGGAQSLLITLARAMQGGGHELSVVNLHKVDALAPQLAAIGAPVTSFPAPNLLEPRRILALCRHLRRVGAEVIHTHLGYSNVLGALCGRMLGIPVIVSLHNARIDPPRHARDRLRIGLEQALLRHSVNRLIAVGPKVAAFHAQFYGAGRIQVIENAVEPVARLPPSGTRAALGWGPDTCVAVTVARLEPVKGVPVLIEAVDHVRRTAPHFRLLLVGDGAERAKLEAEVAARGLGGIVHFAGHRPDVPAFLAEGDLFCLSSLSEGLPISLLEAMSVGLPVVATRVGDVPNVLPPEAGLLVEPGQPAPLAEALATLAGDAGRRAAMGRAAQAAAEPRMNPRRWAERISAVYDAVLAERGVAHRTAMP